MAAVDDKVKQIIVEQLGVDEGEVTASASFVDDLGAARDHHISIIVLNDTEGISDGVGAGGARRGCRLVGTLGAVAHRDLSGGEIDDGGWNEERGDTARATFDQVSVLALDDVESADA